LEYFEQFELFKQFEIFGKNHIKIIHQYVAVLKLVTTSLVLHQISKITFYVCGGGGTVDQNGQFPAIPNVRTYFKQLDSMQYFDYKAAALL
jgi:hypothetical protein